MMPTQLALNLENQSTYQREDFFRDTSNTLAFQALIESWPQWPAVGHILVGPRGSGKTHLGTIWKNISRGIFLPAKECYIKAEVHLKAEAAVPHFILDDFPKKYNEQDVFHLFNRVRDLEGALLILSTRHPQEWELKLPDLESRLRTLPIHNLDNPTDEGLKAVLCKRFADYQMRVPETVTDYVLPRLERSFQAIHTFADLLNEEALAQKKNITLSFVRAFLKNSIY